MAANQSLRRSDDPENWELERYVIPVKFTQDIMKTYENHRFIWGKTWENIRKHGKTCENMGKHHQNSILEDVKKMGI